jgi:uncharacterized protein (UPF0262 family)
MNQKSLRCCDWNVVMKNQEQSQSNAATSLSLIPEEKLNLTKDQIQHLIRLVHDYWPEIVKYDEQIRTKAPNRIEEIALSKGVKSVTPDVIQGLREIYNDYFVSFLI